MTNTALDRIDRFLGYWDNDIAPSNKPAKSDVVWSVGYGIELSVGDIRALRDQLRVLLDAQQLGETEVEWRAEQPSGAWNMSHNRPTETTARAVVEVTRQMGYPIVLQQRLVGPWRDIEDQEADRG